MKAQAEYTATVAQIRAQLAAMAEHIENDDTKPEMINWGHVGSAKHLLKLLKEASAFAWMETAVEDE